ncbi:protein YgfX [Photobacterium sp. Ph5]|uniref:protein YgfX n=1 Tax=Photobacterium sp. Ph5 TaxID=2790953 RepID=UPI003211DA27
MLLTTTVNYADLYLVPSKLQIATLTVAYLCVAIFLLFSSSLLILPIALILCEKLYDEYLNSAIYSYRLQGRFRLSSVGDIYYQQQRGVVTYARPLTRWLIIFKVQGLSYRWLIVWRDSCAEPHYRHIKMFIYLHLSPR